MRKFIVLLVSVAVSAAMIPAQGAANHTVRHKVNNLHAFVHNCLAWTALPIARYGNPDEHGYVYQSGNDSFLATALDQAQRASDTQWIVLVVRPTVPCIRAISGRRTTAFATSTGRRPQLARKAQRLG